LVSAAAPAANEGLEDLDRATELQLRARSLDQLNQVAQLCESALAKGLDKENAEFAKQLLAAALYQRAKFIGEAVLEAETFDRRAEQFRRVAVADLEKGVSHYPELAEAQLLLARLQALPGGDRDKGVKAATEAIRFFPHDKKQRAKALVVRARLTLDPKKRLADYDKAIELDPAYADAWLERAMVHLGQGDHEKAAEQFEKLLEQDATNIEALFGAAEALAQLEKHEEALKYVDRVIEVEPDAAAGYTARAQVHLLMDNKEKALADLDEALRRDSDSIETLLLRAQVRESSDDFNGALVDVERVLQLQPNYPRAILFRSVISARQGKLSAAIADIQLLLRNDPKNTGLRLQLASYYYEGKRLKRAISEYATVLAQEPSNWEALRARGDALLSIGKQAEAIKDYEAALKIQPENSGILNNLAWVLATSPDEKLRDGARSIELAKKACEVTRYKEPHILSTLAAGYAETNDFDSAVQWSTKAVALGKDDLKEQLEKELENYQQKKPWRELQQLEEEPLP
jgi:tetratricopeptide (TPR) repeat protein